jgi:hypothetical protein
MGFFANWIEKIVDRVVASRVDAINEAVVTKTMAAVKDIIDYDALSQCLISNGLDYHQIAEGVDLSDLADEINTDDLEQQIVDRVDTDTIVEKVAENIDNDDIASHVTDNFEMDYTQFDIDYCALAEEIDNDAIADNVRDSLDLDYDAIAEEINYEELGRALIKIAAKTLPNVTTSTN